MSNQNGSKWCTAGERYGVYARDGFACIYCGANRTVLSLDHVEERACGGDHDVENLVTACFSCNSSRQDRGNRVFFAELRARGIDTSSLSARIARQTAKFCDVALGRKLNEAAKAARKASKTAGESTERGHVAAVRAARKLAAKAA